MNKTPSPGRCSILVERRPWPPPPPDYPCVWPSRRPPPVGGRHRQLVAKRITRALANSGAFFQPVGLWDTSALSPPSRVPANVSQYGACQCATARPRRSVEQVAERARPVSASRPTLALLILILILILPLARTQPIEYLRLAAKLFLRHLRCRRRSNFGSALWRSFRFRALWS